MPDYRAALGLRMLRSHPEGATPAWKNLTNRSHAHGPAMAPLPDGAAIASCGNVMRAPRRLLFTATVRIAWFGPCFPGRAVRTVLSGSCFTSRALRIVLPDGALRIERPGSRHASRVARVAPPESQDGRPALQSGYPPRRDRGASVSSPFASLRLRMRSRAASSLQMHRNDIESVSEASTGIPECVVGKL